MLKRKIPIFIYSAVLYLCLFVPLLVFAQQKVVIGYIPTWVDMRATIDNTDLDIITHINLAFINPNAAGAITSGGNLLCSDASVADIQYVINKAHQNGVKVLASLAGGAVPSCSGDWRSLLQAGNRTTLVNNLVNFANTFNLDGIDVDIEGGLLTSIDNDGNYTPFIQELRARLNPLNKLVTCATASYSGGMIPTSSIPYFDYINIMSYDNDWGSVNNHSTYEHALLHIQRWRDRGAPDNKLVLGVPFYGYSGSVGSGYSSYKSIVSLNSAAANVDEYAGYKYNGIPTIEAKTQYAADNITGVMIWEISQDASGDLSLLQAIGRNIDSGTPSPGVSVPATIQAEDYIAMSGVQTEATTDTGGGSNVGWVDPNDWLEYRINVSSPGTYNIHYRVATTAEGAQISLNLNGSNLSTTILPNTGGWQNWTTVSTSAYLNSGTHTVRLTDTNGKWNLNWWQVESGNVPSLEDITDKPGQISAQYNDSPQNEDIGKLIDNSSSTKYLTFNSGAWVQFQVASSYVVSRYTLTSANDHAERDPQQWTLQGSNDGATWTLLDSRSAEDFPNRFEKRSFSFSNTQAFSYYRFLMSNNSGTILQLAEWELFGVSGNSGTDNTMLSPASGETFSQAEGVPFQFSVNPEVAHIVLYYSEDYIDIATISSPFTYTWFPAVQGQVQLNYEYYDSDWNFIEVGSRNINVVSNGPVVALTTVSANQVLTSTVHVNATAYTPSVGTSDGDGVQSLVFDLLQNGNVVATRTENLAPFDWYLDTTSLANGDYVLRVTSLATANAGGETSLISIPVSVVNN